MRVASVPILAYVLFFGLLGLSTADEDIILKPLSVKANVPTKVLIFIPGGNVPNYHYNLTAAAIQNNSEVNLWVVIPAVTKRLCIIECTATFICLPLYNTVNGAISKAEAAGMPKGVDQHLAGHSLGGTCANYLVQAYPKGGYKSLMVMGAYVDETGKANLVDYPIPVATIGAELDGGQARPGKLALWVKQFYNYSNTSGADFALSTKPVLIIPSIDHSDFCPGFAVPGDLPSEVDQPTASSAIGQVAGAYLNVRTLPATHPAVINSISVIKKYWDQTQSMTGPILSALSLEVTGGDMSGTGSYSPWCNAAQLQLSGVSTTDQAKITLIDNYADGDFAFEHTRVKYVPDSGKLTLNISSHLSPYIDVMNTGTFIAAKEIGCKLVNFDRVAQQLKTAVVSKTAQCRDVNEKALNTALGLAPNRSLSRYKSRGRGVCFVDDEQQLIGPVFIFTRLKLTESAKCLTVQSIKLQTFLGGKIMPGVHYCKLLSPARILDWIMTDSLKPGKK